MTHRRQAKLTPGKASYVSPNRGLDLLDEAIEQIEWQANSVKNQWEQGHYRCSSGMCLAGWIAQLAGGEWAFSANSIYGSDLIAVPEDEGYPYFGVGDIYDGDGYDVDVFREENGTRVIGAHERAQRLAGLSCEEADLLFDGGNTLDDIKRKRAKLG